MSKFRIDVDGVVAGLVQRTLELLNEEFPNETVPTYNQLTIWDIYHGKDSPLNLRQREYAVKKLAEPGFAMSLPLIHNAKEAITKIQNGDNEIIWVTTPYLRSKTWEDDRRQWLFEHFDVNPKDVEFTHHKWYYQGDVFIDDKLDNVIKWRSHNDGLAVVFDAPWNQGGPKLPRLHNWNAIDKILMSQHAS